MITIPNYAPTSTSQATPLISGSAAAAPYEALQSVARGIGKAAGVAEEIAHEIQQVENDGDILEANRAMAASEAAFQQSLIEDHNYKGYAGRLEAEVLTPAKSLIRPDMAPAVRRQLEQGIQSWSADLQIRTSKAAQLKAIERTDQQLRLTGEAFIESGDYAGHMAAISNAKHLTPEEKQLRIDEARQLHQDRGIEQSIQREPAMWMTENPEPPEDPAEYSKWRARRELAKRELRAITAEATDEAIDLIIDNKISTAEQIDELYEDLRPQARAQLKGALARHLQNQNQPEPDTPEKIHARIGEVGQLIADYNPSGEEFDAHYVRAASLIESLPKGALRDEYQRQLDGMRKGADQAIRNVEQWGNKQIDEMLQEQIKALPEIETDRRTIREFIGDGFFDDDAKMLSLGFSEKQIAIIREAEEDTDDTILGSLLPDNETTASAQLDAFKEQWEKRTGEVTADDAALELAKKFSSGRGVVDDFYGEGSPVGSSISQNDEAKAALLERSGQMRAELFEWLDAHPNRKGLTVDDIATRLKLIGTDIEAGATNASYQIREAAPKATPGSSTRRADIPYNGVPANVRYNNPAAAYPRKKDEKYGLLGYGVLNGGKQGTHKIGRFPTPVHGAAANFDLFADKYVGMTAYQAVRKWRGNGGRGEKTVVPKGYDPSMKIDADFMADPVRAIDFFKKMALHESPRFRGMTDDDWSAAYDMWLEVNS